MFSHFSKLFVVLGYYIGEDQWTVILNYGITDDTNPEISYIQDCCLASISVEKPEYPFIELSGSAITNEQQKRSLCISDLQWPMEELPTVDTCRVNPLHLLENADILDIDGTKTCTASYHIDEFFQRMVLGKILGSRL